ncbi:hypothetical protein HanPI659440_Chr09g0342041 [Helianthus annuus]|nr:hypothetical protein HanPI659440_Chr09g0342041 [Helianthus annuus]
MFHSFQVLPCTLSTVSRFIIKTKTLQRMIFNLRQPLLRCFKPILLIFPGSKKPRNVLPTKLNLHLQRVNPKTNRHTTVLHNLLLSTMNNLRLPHLQRS